jgi:hypothetical protein
MTTDTTQHEFKPGWAIPPAETLLEWAEEAGMTPELLRTCLRLSMPELLPLLNEPPALLTPHNAQQLETLTDIPARLWERLEAFYRADLARIAAKRAQQKTPAKTTGAEGGAAINRGEAGTSAAQGNPRSRERDKE